MKTASNLAYPNRRMGHGDLTAATFWMGAPWGIDDIRVNASAAHTWGKRTVGCEAFTGAPLTTQWNQDPYSLKPLGDLAFTKGAKEVIANPDPGIEYVKARDGIINVDLEKRRLRMAIDAGVASPDARTEGFGVVVPGRLALMASQVSDAFATKTRVDPNTVWTDSVLPPKAELNILPKK